MNKTIDRRKVEAVLGNPPITGYFAMPDKELAYINKKLQDANIKLYKGSFSLDSIKKLDDHYIVHLHGGNNGNSDWPMYLKQLSKITAALKNSWVIRIDNDCLDDIFECYIGLPNNYFE